MNEMEARWRAKEAYRKELEKLEAFETILEKGMVGLLVIMMVSIIGFALYMGLR